MMKTFKTENGTTIEVRVTEPQRVDVTGKIMEIPKGTRMVAENTTKGIRYEYVNTEELEKADFEEERPTDSQKELQELILTEGFPHQKEGVLFRDTLFIADKKPTYNTLILE